MDRLCRGSATVRALVLVASLLAGCVSLADEGGPWEPIETITGGLTPEVGPPATIAATASCTLRVATWNVHFGADPHELAAAIAAAPRIARADVLLLQEIEDHTLDDEATTRASRIATELGMTWIYAPARTEDFGTHGIATLARFPLTDATIRRLPHYDQLIRPRERNALSTYVELGTQRLQIVNIHLDVRIGPGDRIRQLHPAVNEIDERVIAAGDFNTNPWAWSNGIIPLAGTEAIVGQQQAAVVDDYLEGKAFSSAIDADTATMRLPAFEIRTDNLYARALPILAAGVEHVGGSDHWPVWFDVDLCD